MGETREKLIRGDFYTCYSQPETAQDEWVIHTLRGRMGGFFIEVGAYDGAYHSNTLTLEQQLKWTGILIEADWSAANMAARTRTARVLNYTVAPDSRRRRFFDAGQWSGLEEFMRPNLLAGHTAYNNRVIWKPTNSLQLILAPGYTPPVVDYLSIDVEGAEYPILESYCRAPDAGRFRCMTIECGQNQDDLGKLVELLQPLGYRLDRVQAWERYWINPELI